MHNIMFLVIRNFSLGCESHVTVGVELSQTNIIIANPASLHRRFHTVGVFIAIISSNFAELKSGHS